KWGWKRLAANLLLIPVMTGATAATAFAQFGSGTSAPGAAPAVGMTASRTPGSAMPASGDPKALLREGRRAVLAGQYDRAQDLARAAEANNPAGQWGRFHDTPNALLKDIQAAVVKAQKTQADQLMKDAKGLMVKPTGNDAEKAANLDRALQMAQRADQLHGPYSAWDFGDRPDKLCKEIQTARARIRTVPAASAAATATPPLIPAGGTGNAASQFSSAFQPSGPSSPQNPAGARPAAGNNDPKKAAAVQLMTEGKKLADQGNFAAARSKYTEADRIGANFGPGEYTP